MRTLSVQQMPNGYELEVPPFSYWVKAGIGLTLGAGAVLITWSLVWILLIIRFKDLYVLRLFHLI